MPNVGDIVLYTMEFDTDTSYSPNIGPAVVTKVLDVVNSAGPVLDLMVFFQNGTFTKLEASCGPVGTRGTWHPKPAPAVS